MCKHSQKNQESLHHNDYTLAEPVRIQSLHNKCEASYGWFLMHVETVCTRLSLPLGELDNETQFFNISYCIICCEL